MLTLVLCINAAGTYSAKLTCTKNVADIGDTVYVKINIASADYSDFSAAEVKVEYDSDLLALNGNASQLSGAAFSDNGNGKLMIIDYGPVQQFGDTYVLAFTALTDGEAEIKLTSAKFSDIRSAENENLVSASIPSDSDTVKVTIKPQGHTVTIDKKLFVGPSSVGDGEDYTFVLASDAGNYNYGTISAKVDGVPVQIIANGDGSFTVENITGSLVITGSRTPKKYSVKINGEILSSDGKEATYGKDYKFTLKADVPAGSEAGKTYVISSIKINGKQYKSYKYDSYTRIVTIKGKDIKGDIEINVEVKEVPVSTFTITLEALSGMAEGSYPATVPYGSDHTITLADIPGYVYKISATMDNEPIELEKGEGNTYVIKNVTGNVVVTVNAEVPTDKIEVNRYITLDNSFAWLVLNKVEKLENGVYEMNGEAMLWSDKYQAYCYVTIGTEAPEVSLEVKAGNTVSVDYSGDTDGDGDVDTSDILMVQNIYSADYGAFNEEISPENFLSADLNGSGNVNMQDAASLALILTEIN